MNLDFRSTNLSLGARFMAMSIDFILTLPAFFFVIAMIDLVGAMGLYALLDSLTNILNIEKDIFGNILATIIVLVFMWFWLDGTTVNGRAGSVGQRLMKIVVVDSEGGIPGCGRRLVRFGLRMVYAVPIGISIFIVSKHSENEVAVALSQVSMGIFLLLMSFSVVCFFIGRPLFHDIFSGTRPALAERNIQVPNEVNE